MSLGTSDDLLQFKDFSDSPSTSSPPPAQINVNSPSASKAESQRMRGDPLSNLIYDISNSAGIDNSNEGNADTNADADGNSKVSFLTIEYYQKFFNVDTFMVLERIVNSIIPKRAGEKYLRSTIGGNPDLYGPFWITVTLIFSIAISGNIANYMQHANDEYHWRYNFHLVSYAATCIFLYVNVVPGILWVLFKYSLKPEAEGSLNENSNYTPSLLSLMCVYGYSLSIYIPVSILWVIQISLLQWALVITAASLSGLVLVIILSPALKNSKFSLFLMIGILCAHLLLAAGFMLYFFHVPSNPLITDRSPHLHPYTEVAKQVKITIAQSGGVGNRNTS